MTSGVAKLNGVVLAGGKSLRMGEDKGAINWHGVPQREYMAALLSRYCNTIYISCRDEQQINDSNYPVLVDSYTGMGPYGAILSAFAKDPNSAWLVVACDLPLLDESTLHQLIASRDANAIATTFESPHDGLPEPLITIWEPKAFPYLLSLVDEGYKCPRKALIKSDNVHIIKAKYPDALLNTNTPEDAAKVREILKKQQADARA
jgi:molybdenum cofactor guanylyltransferase